MHTILMQNSSELIIELHAFSFIRTPFIRNTERQKNHTTTSEVETICQVAVDLRESILSMKNEKAMSWPPKQTDLTADAVQIPDSVRTFLCTLLTGNTDPLEICPQRVQRLVSSFGQDLVFGVTCGQVQTPKHVLLPYAVKSLTNNVQLIRIINRCGHGVSYSQIEELSTALCLQKLASSPDDAVPLPENIHSFVSTTLAWDNIDRLEETLSGAGTSHRVNGIVVQAAHFGPYLPSARTTDVAKTKRRSIDVVPDKQLPIYNVGERSGPPSRPYVEVTSAEIDANAWRKNLLWILVRLYSTESQTVSGWTGFNIKVRSEESGAGKDSIGYLPTIDAPATDMSTVFEVLRQSVKIKESLQLNTIVVVFDQALYSKAIEIKWKHNQQFENVILRMGVFHTICVLLGIIGKRFKDAGLRDLCVEAQVIAEGSVSGVLEGRRYNRAVRLHKLVYEALMRQAWAGFQTWIEENHGDKKSLVDNAFGSLQRLHDSICQAEFQRTLDEKSFSEVTELFRRYMLFLRTENGTLSEFWVSYLDLVDILLSMIRATREGDWELHISSIRNLIPWCFAYDNINYARYLSSYLSEMTHLEEEHPEVLTHFKSGGFAVQIGDCNPFGKIPVDQACEETVNKDTQTPGGTKGFSLKPKAVNKYYLVAEYRSIFMRNLKDMLHLNKSDCQHNDLQKTRITRDEKDVQSLLSTLEGWTNPFESPGQELICLSTGRLATADVSRDLLQARNLGEKSYRRFSEERLESDPPKVKFHDTLSKTKLKTFDNMNKKMKLRGTSKEIVLKADRAVFSQMIIIAETRQLSMREVLSHPLGPFPWSLAAPDGSLKKTTKAVLAKELEKDTPAVENLPVQSACIIDGMAMVQKLKGDKKTFRDVADVLLAMVLREGATSSRIDVVFDEYRDISIKDAEREKRGAESGNEFRNIQPEHRVLQWRRFLLNPLNKQQLIQFIVREWQTERCRRKLAGKKLYTTAGEECYEISRSDVSVCEELGSTQEEADTRLLLHAHHAARTGFDHVVISADDTDVFVLCLAFKNFIQSALYLKRGTQARTRYIDITHVVQHHGSALCRSLPGLHAFTGCDSVSAFSGKGKLSALKLTKQHRQYMEIFQELGTEWEVSDELFAGLQDFTCLMYSTKPETSDVDELRYRLFCAKKGNLESSQLPPCADTLRKHCDRANYQAAIWRRSLQSRPQVPSPVSHGWSLEEGRLTMDWMSGEPAPVAVLELLSCQCKKSCQLPNCTCLSNGLLCTDLCGLVDCENRQEPTTEAVVDDEEEDEVDDGD